MTWELTVMQIQSPSWLIFSDLLGSIGTLTASLCTRMCLAFDQCSVVTPAVTGVAVQFSLTHLSATVTLQPVRDKACRLIHTVSHPTSHFTVLMLGCCSDNSQWQQSSGNKKEWEWIVLNDNYTRVSVSGLMSLSLAAPPCGFLLSSSTSFATTLPCHPTASPSSRYRKYRNPPCALYPFTHSSKI